MNETYLTVQEAAKILKIHPRTVTKFLTTGQLRGAKIGRIWRLTEEDVKIFFESIRSQTSEAIKGSNDND